MTGGSAPSQGRVVVRYGDSSPRLTAGKLNPTRCGCRRPQARGPRLFLEAGPARIRRISVRASSQRNDPHHARAVADDEADEVHARLHSGAVVANPVPAHDVPPGSGRTLDERAQTATREVVDADIHSLIRLGGGVSDLGRLRERVGPWAVELPCEVQVR